MAPCKFLIENSCYNFLKELGLNKLNSGVFDGQWYGNGEIVISYSPATAEPIASIQLASEEDYERCVDSAHGAWKQWLKLPAPKRGDIIRQIGNAVRDKSESLAKLISLEMGKLISESRDEVQEFINTCDYANGLSRTFAGKVLPSVRLHHTLLENWHPIGVIAVLTASNFPTSVFGWNALVAMVCGNVVLWKEDDATLLVSIALTKIIGEVLKKNKISGAVCSLCNGKDKPNLIELMSNDPLIPFISYTGPLETGRKIGVKVQERFGKVMLELGGNNAFIVHEDADLDLVMKSLVPACLRTTGQQCTSTRRLILHCKVYDEILEKLIKSYQEVLTNVGDPLCERTTYGPVITKSGVEGFQKTIAEATSAQFGGVIEFGGKVIDRPGYFVEPTIISGLKPDDGIVSKVPYVPILYIFKVNSFDEAIEINNNTGLALSSCLFTKDLSNALKWLGPCGSECGIANVNISPSGVELGAAFGGEKDNGGYREAGSDVWKQFMRRLTITINNTCEYVP